MAKPNTNQNMKAARKIVKKVKKTHKSRIVFRHINVFALLSAAELAQIKADLKDILGKDLNLNDFNKALSEAKGNALSLEGDLPAIITNDSQLRETTELCLEALEQINDPPRIFRRTDHMVRLISDEETGLQPEIMGRSQLTSVLARAASYFKKTANGIVPDRPPAEVVQDILALRDRRFPFLNRVVQAPVLRADGTILTTPGYDEQSKLYYHPHGDLPPLDVPQFPSDEEVKKAVKLIRKLIGQFSFAQEADLANACGLFLTPHVRPAIPGNVPMATIDAPSMGSGKTLLATLVSVIATGADPYALVPSAFQEEEMRKKITSALRTAPATILIDDVDFVLESRSLTTVLTSKIWQDRLLGTNKHISLPHTTVWMAAGNNLRIGRDLRRRCYWVRLNPKTSRPWRESKYKIKDLTQWVERRRPKLLVAFLTLARAWFVAKEDEEFQAKRVPQFSGFDKWARVVGGILNFAGINGFLENMEAFYDRVDEESSYWEVFLKGVAKKYLGQTFTVKELSEEMADGLKDYLPPDLEEALAAAAEDPGKSFERSLGKALAKMDGRMFGPGKYQVVRVGMKARAVQWKVTRGEAEG